MPPPRNRRPSGRRRAQGPPKPWQRAVAAVVLLASVIGVVLILVTGGPGRTDWSKHVTGATFTLLLVGGLSGAISFPTITMKVFTALGWTFPVAMVWLGIEYWVNWFAFYDDSGRNKVTSEGSARITGSFVIVIGVVGLVLYGVLLQLVRRHRPPAPVGAKVDLVKRRR